MNEYRAFALRQIREPSLIDDVFLVAHTPRRPLRLLIYGAVHRKIVVGDGIVIIAANDAVFIEGQLEEIIGGLFFALDEAIDAERLPRLVGRRLGGAAGR